MSKLHFTENGRAIATLGEEVTTFRRIRKIVHLPGTAAPATLYILTRPYPDSTLPLHLSVNGRQTDSIQPVPRESLGWYQVTLDPDLVRSGDNSFELWCDATAMNAWSIALEAGHRDPRSYVSDDGGATWRNHSMGYLNTMRCEYVIRVRLAEGSDPEPPEMVYEDADSPRLASLRRIVPEAAATAGSPIDAARALNAWLAASWEHTGGTLAAQYAPWDAETIIDWGGKRRGHAGQRPVAMCVHYGAAFVSSCQTLGIPARCAVFADRPDGTAGHFTGEFWSREHEKWVMADPNLDALFWRDGIPLSASEVQDAAPHLAEIVEFGPGHQAQMANPRIRKWVEDGYLEGRSFRHRAVWYRSDLLTRPELSPPSHGSIAYCETGLVWDRRDAGRFGMFPYFGDVAYFDAPPSSG